MAKLITSDLNGVRATLTIGMDVNNRALIGLLNQAEDDPNSLDIAGIHLDTATLDELIAGLVELRQIMTATHAGGGELVAVR